MSRESREDRSQKTVAELLALHGGNNLEGSRRRRRRAADDDDVAPEETGGPRRARDVTETGPQAIIDRVRSNGAPPPPGRNGRRGAPEAPGRQNSGGFRRPEPGPPAAPGQQSSAAMPRPVQPERPDNGVLPRRGQQDSGGFARPNTGALPPPPQDSMPMRRPHPQDTGFARRPPQEPGPVPGPPQESGAMPVPPADAAPPPLRRRTAEETSTNLAARLDGLEAPADPETPPAGGRATGAFPPPRRPRRAPARVTPPPEPSTEQFEPVGEGPSPEESPVPDGPPAGLNAPPAGLQRWRRRREEVQNEDTEVGIMPPVPAADPDEPTGFHQPPVPPGRPPRGDAPDPADDLEATGFHDPFADDDDEVDEFGDFGPAEEAAEARYGFDDEPADAADEDVEPDEAERAGEPSPAKQWLSMAGQLAGGVVGGAAVWLGFNWLWGQIPAAALVAALVVIVGLVWIVRRIRRADDIQTTVLAVLVGLVVTVSPAALLLLSR